MSERVYENLAQWVLLDDNELIKVIEATGASRLSKMDLCLHDSFLRAQWKRQAD